MFMTHEEARKLIDRLNAMGIAYQDVLAAVLSHWRELGMPLPGMPNTREHARYRRAAIHLNKAIRTYEGELIMLRKQAD